MALDININWPAVPQILELLQSINSKLDIILAKETLVMADLDQVIAEVTNETTQIASVQTLITSIEQQLQDALSGASLPPAVQAKVDQVFASLQSNSAALATALQANTVPTPAPDQPPTP